MSAVINQICHDLDRYHLKSLYEINHLFGFDYYMKYCDYLLCIRKLEEQGSKPLIRNILGMSLNGLKKEITIMLLFIDSLGLMTC